MTPEHPAGADTTAAKEAVDPALPPRRAVHSFVTRRGRITTAQERALETLGPRYVIPWDEYCTDLVSRCRAQESAELVRSPRTILEIGFGMGRATAHIAGLMPDTLFIGCEVHEAGVGALLKLIGDLGLKNIRIVQHDAVEALQRSVPAASLDGVHIFFPDPWPKKRHHKRRLIQQPFVHELATRLKPGGVLHCATDWQPYAEQMLDVLQAEPLLRNTAEGYAPRPDYRPLTKFELRGLRLGHGVWDLLFQRI